MSIDINVKYECACTHTHTPTHTHIHTHTHTHIHAHTWAHNSWCGMNKIRQMNAEEVGFERQLERSDRRWILAEKGREFQTTGLTYKKARSLLLLHRSVHWKFEQKSVRSRPKWSWWRVEMKKVWEIQRCAGVHSVITQIYSFVVNAGFHT